MKAERHVRILAFVQYYLPDEGSGGPARSVSNLVESLGAEFEFRIVVCDRSMLSRQRHPGLIPGAWHQVGQASVLYIDPRPRLTEIGRLLKDVPHDVLYLNSLFNPGFTLTPLLARALARDRRPCILAPRGECGRAARALRPLRKSACLLASRGLSLYRGVTFQASTAEEAGDITRVLGAGAPVVLAPELLAARTTAPHTGAGSGRQPHAPLRVCFVSRIAPMKNLDFALHALKQTTAPLELEVYGPIENRQYWQRCQRLMAVLPGNVRACYRGSLPRSAVPGVIGAHDLLFLPTRGEGYGHVIAEALAAGTPVLTSDRTPWGGIEATGAGWTMPLESTAAFALRLDEIATMDAGDYARRRAAASAYLLQHVDTAAALDANRRMFCEAYA